MYGFSQDENHLLFIDCFGLTRLTLPKGVKTDRKILGSDSGGLASVSRDGSAAASYEDLWNKSVLWSFPELKSSTRFDRFRESGVVVHPDGERYLVPESGAVAVKPMFKGVLLPLRLDASADDDDKPAAPVSLALGGGTKLAGLELGTGKPDVPAPLRVDHDGTLLYYTGSELIGAKLDGSTAKVAWRRTLHTPDRAWLSLWGSATRTVLVLQRGPRFVVIDMGAAPEAKTTKERRFELTSLAAPVVAGPWIAYQPSPTVVARRHLETGEVSEHDLAIVDPKRKVELDHSGPCTLFLAASGKLLVLPRHREAILDLGAGVEIPRKLPAKEFELRQAILSHARPYLEAARSAGVNIELGRVELQANYNSVSVTHRIAGGESFAGALLAGASQSAWSNVSLPGGWRMGSYGSHGGINFSATVARDAFVDSYAALTAAGMSFPGTIGFWADAFENRARGYSGSDGPPCDDAAAAVLAQALVTVVRDGADAKLDFAALAARGAPSIKEILAAYAHYPKRTQELDYSTTKLSGHLFNRLHGAAAARIWVSLFLDAKGWDNRGTHYSDFGNYAVVPLLDAEPGAAAPFKAWFDAHGLPDDDRRWALQPIYDRVCA